MLSFIHRRNQYSGTHSCMSRTVCFGNYGSSDVLSAFGRDSIITVKFFCKVMLAVYLTHYISQRREIVVSYTLSVNRYTYIQYQSYIM